MSAAIELSADIDNRLYLPQRWSGWQHLHSGERRKEVNHLITLVSSSRHVTKLADKTVNMSSRASGIVQKQTKPRLEWIYDLPIVHVVRAVVFRTVICGLSQ
jgi:hypothetical protein